MNNPNQMPEYIARIQLRYEKMHGAERKLADYFINRNPAEGLNASVSQLADTVGVSVASVVRFCQKLGYVGFAEFKLMTKYVGFIPTVGNITMDENMSSSQIKKNVCDFTSVNIQKCMQTIDDTQLDKAINAIRSANHLLICGIGTSAGIAMAAANTFMNLNIPSTPLYEELLMLRSVALARPGDVILAITACGYMKPVVDAMKLAKDEGATTILLTGEDKSLARKYADFILHSTSNGRPGVLDMLTVTSCQLVVVQILEAGCIARYDPSVLDRVQKNLHLSEMARYSSSVDSIRKSRVKY